MAGRTIRDERDARTCLEAVQAAGLSRMEWARAHGIDGRSLYAWEKKLGQGQLKRRRGRGRLVELIPAMGSGSGSGNGQTRYLIRCGQLAVEVDAQFDEQTLTRLLRVVVGC